MPRRLCDDDGVDGPWNRLMSAPIARPCPICGKPDAVTPGRVTCGRSECQEENYRRNAAERGARWRRRPGVR